MTAFELLAPSEPLWEKVMDYAAHCSWRAGKILAQRMSERAFSGWERVVAAHDADWICGFCVVARDDCIPGLSYTPYIGYLFVGEPYRGNRLSQRMISFAAEYLKAVGFSSVYLVSDHENLYEKYGFQVVDRQLAPWGKLQKIYRLSFQAHHVPERQK